MSLTIQQLDSMVFMVPGRGGVQLFIAPNGEIMAREANGTEFGPVLVTALPDSVNYLRLPMVDESEVDVPQSGHVAVFVDADGAMLAKLHDGTVVATLRGQKGDKGDKGDDGAQGVAGSQGLQGIQCIAGARGPRGFASNVTVGNVYTGAPGSDAEVTIEGTAPDYAINFVIPRGAQGPAGEGGGGSSSPVKVAEWATWGNVSEVVSEVIASNVDVTAILSEFMVLVCTSADLGYSVGAKIRLNSGVCGDGSPLWIHQKGGLGQDHIYTTGGAAPEVESWNSNLYEAITPSKWRAELWAVIP